MFVVGEALIDDSVAAAAFCCDLSKCYGACCTIPGARGAPLTDREVLEVERAYPAVKEYLAEKSLRTIERAGLYEGGPGNFATTCIEERECVFVYFERGSARCGFERAYLDGKTSWRKPMSCHLFPIRIRETTIDPTPKEMLHYEEIEQCRAGRERGEIHQIALGGFLQEPLTRKYGATWYGEFLEVCKTRCCNSC